MICELSCIVIVMLWLPLTLMIVAATTDDLPHIQRAWSWRSNSPVYRGVAPSSAATSSGSPVRGRIVGRGSSSTLRESLGRFCGLRQGLSP